MLLLYICLCSFCFYLSLKKYKKVINILSLYIFIWLLNVLLYELKLLQYNNLEIKTWLILCANIIIFSFGCLIPKKNFLSCLDDKEIDESTLLKIIIISCIIASIGIIPNLLMLISKYGYNILKSTTYIYADNLNGNGIKAIPYLGSLSMFALLLTSTYITNYGFKKILVLPLVLVILDILPSGSRGNLILALLLLLIPYIFNNKSYNTSRIKSIVSISLMIVGLLTFYSIFTYNRRPNTTIEPYVSETMVEINNYVPIAHKSYLYFTSPLGVLNEYLKEPRFLFGINTFSVERNFLNKFGLDVKYEATQPAYNIPMRTNVGTWLKDFCEDFTIPGMFIVIFGVSWFFDGIYMKSRKYINSQILFNLTGMLIYLSWFYFYLRQGSVTIVIIATIVLLVYMSLRNKHLKRN